MAAARPLAPLLLLALSTVAAAGGAQAPPFILALHCDDDAGPLASVEAEYFGDGCWGHLGMHQYFVGRDTVYALDAGRGNVFAVEQQLSPPVEPGAPTTVPPGVNTTLAVETSLDGLAWQRVADIQYRFVRHPVSVSLAQDQRQSIDFSFQGAGQPFRFLRIREPLSAAHGLSGYVDFSRVDLTVRALGPAPAAALAAEAAQPRDCAQHILERLSPAHPCTFGGVEHWDAPSWFHTYFLGDARLDRVGGSAVLAYFRPDDPGTCCGQTAAGVLGGPLLVRASVDGVHWTTVGSAPATYGAPAPFEFGDLAGLPAAFLQVASGRHPGYNQHPALKHPEAFLVLSQLELGGQLPPAP